MYSDMFTVKLWTIFSSFQKNQYFGIKIPSLKGTLENVIYQFPLQQE